MLYKFGLLIQNAERTGANWVYFYFDMVTPSEPQLVHKEPQAMPMTILNSKLEEISVETLRDAINRSSRDAGTS